jgi:hypothetical protein
MLKAYFGSIHTELDLIAPHTDGWESNRTAITILRSVQGDERT